MEVVAEIRQYLALKKWQYRSLPDKKNIAIKQCPFCGKAKWKFYIHARNSMYRCWHCSATGNLYKMKRELGDLKGIVSAAHAAGGKTKKTKLVPTEAVAKWHKRLLRDEKALEYLDRRGIQLDAIKHFQLGCRTKEGIKWLAIPHIENGECKNVKFRSLPPAEKTFRRIEGSASILHNVDALADYETVVIAEGELDAISYWQAGVQNVVGLTAGAETFLPEWFDLMADKQEIILALDADPVGQDGARNIARRVGFDKTKNVLLPFKDANEVLTALGPAELAKTISTAEKFEVHGILSVNDALIQTTTQSEMQDSGLTTPWLSVNRLIGSGWHTGDLVVLSAKIKVGKTTWALNLARHFALQGIPALVFCLEMRPDRLAQKLVAIHRRRSIDDLELVDYHLTRYFMQDVPLYFVEPDWGGKLNVENVMQKIRETVKRYGIRFMVFDHLHFLCRSLQYLTNEVGQVCRAFKLLSEELEICTMLIAQPKKIQGDRVIRYDDIKDSSAIPADADQVILLHRNVIPAGTAANLDDNEDREVLEPKTLVRIDAARFRGGGETNLYYQGETGLFYDYDERPEAAHA